MTSMQKVIGVLRKAGMYDRTRHGAHPFHCSVYRTTGGYNVTVGTISPWQEVEEIKEIENRGRVAVKAVLDAAGMEWADGKYGMIFVEKDRTERLAQEERARIWHEESIEKDRQIAAQRKADEDAKIARFNRIMEMGDAIARGHGTAGWGHQGSQILSLLEKCAQDGLYDAMEILEALYNSRRYEA